MIVMIVAGVLTLVVGVLAVRESHRSIKQNDREAFCRGEAVAPRHVAGGIVTW